MLLVAVIVVAVGVQEVYSLLVMAGYGSDEL